jgi:hypothetical protein
MKVMKLRYIVILGIVVVPILALALRSNRPALAGNGAVESYSFGMAASRSVVSHSFKVANRSSKNATIKQVVSSCSCTVVKDFPALIAPGTSVDMPVYFTAGREPGDVASTVVVIFDDGQKYEFRLTGKVVVELPDRIDFGSVLQTSNEEREFAFVSLDKRDMLVKSIELDDSMFKLVERPAQSSSELKFRIAISPTIKIGQFKEPLRLTLSDGRTRMIELTGRVRQLIEAEQDTLTLGPVSQGKTLEKEFRIRSPYSKPVKNVKIRCIPEGVVSATVVRSSSDLSEMDVRVIVKYVEDRSVLSGSVEISGEADGKSSICTVDVYALMKR